MPVDIRQMIVDALLTLLKKKKLEKITIKEITDQCDISRQTFYYYFKDVIEVVEWWAQKSFQQLVASSIQADSPRASIGVFVRFVVQYHDVIQSLLECRWRAQMEKLIVDAVIDYLKSMAVDKFPNASISPAEMEVSLHFCAFGLTGVLLTYCTDGLSMDQETLIEQLCHLFSQNAAFSKLEGV